MHAFGVWQGLQSYMHLGFMVDLSRIERWIYFLLGGEPILLLVSNKHSLVAHCATNFDFLYL